MRCGVNGYRRDCVSGHLSIKLAQIVGSGGRVSGHVSIEHA